MSEETQEPGTITKTPQGNEAKYTAAYADGPVQMKPSGSVYTPGGTTEAEDTEWPSE